MSATELAQALLARLPAIRDSTATQIELRVALKRYIEESRR